MLLSSATTLERSADPSPWGLSTAIKITSASRASSLRPSGPAKITSRSPRPGTPGPRDPARRKVSGRGEFSQAIFVFVYAPHRWPRRERHAPVTSPMYPAPTTPTSNLPAKTTALITKPSVYRHQKILGDRSTRFISATIREASRCSRWRRVGIALSRLPCRTGGFSPCGSGARYPTTSTSRARS
jgi:hypothetical protein